MTRSLREDAWNIWSAGLAAAQPEPAVKRILHGSLAAVIERAERLIVVGAGKAGSAMASAVEDALAHRIADMRGWVNVPAGSERPTQAIRLHPARPAGSNSPTAEGVTGSEEMLRLVRSAGPRDVVLCLISGGGSALMPAPVSAISLADKQQTTRLMSAAGVPIHGMNAVRKHLSRIKGGRLAAEFTGLEWHSLVISDVIGDPLDVIASGPTAPDSSTFAEAIAVLGRYQLVERVPVAVWRYLQGGAAGRYPETPKTLPSNIFHHILASNSKSLTAACERAISLGYRVLNLGSFIEGETREVASVICGIIRAIQTPEGVPIAPPACLLLGGETTVTLGDAPGQGGRNQEFALACLASMKSNGLAGVAVLSAGTDGEDGPTDAAGGYVDAEVAQRVRESQADCEQSLLRHDAYPFLRDHGGLIRTGLTGTNVMDIRVILVV